MEMTLTGPERFVLRETLEKAINEMLMEIKEEHKLRRLGRPGRPPSRFTALSSAMNPTSESNLHFDSDSYPIGVDNHASRCMANAPHLFRDLKLIPEGEQVSGIGEGLAIKGVGT